MIKILFFIEKLYGGGAEKALCNLVNSMDQSIFDITVQTIWKYDPTDHLKPGIRYKYCYEQKNNKNHTLFRIQAALGLVYQWYVKDDYDIEIAFLECEATKVIASSSNKHAKKCAWVHCDFLKAFPDLESFVKKNRDKYKKFDRIVCVCETVQNSYKKLFGDSPESVVLHNTVDDSAIIERSTIHNSEIQKRKTTVVILGSIYYPKNYPRLIEATYRLKQEEFDFDLWILGDGADRNKIESLIAEKGLSNSVKVWGFQDNPYPFIASADLLVCSSIYEGFSTFITEGLILGKPIVTTDCSGMRELLGESEFGLITENDDNSFYEGMKKMLEDPQLREAYAQAAAQRGKAFSKAKRIAETENFFRGVLEEKQKH